MTKLSKKKIKFIRNNRKRLSAKEIALRLGLKESDVRKAIRKWDEATKEDIEKERADSKGGFLQSMMNYMFYILLLFSPLIYYPRIQNFSNLPKATFIQFAICILVLVWLLKSRRSGSLEYIRHPIMIALGLWLLWTGASILWSADRFAGMVLWLHWFICALCFFIIINSFRRLEQLDRIAFFSVLGAAVISILGFFQYVSGMDFIPQGAVPGGTFSNKNIAAQFIVMIWPLSLLLFLLSRDRKRYWFFAFIYSILLIFLIYSKARAGWVAVFVGLLTLMIFILISGFWREIKVFLPREKLVLLLCSVIFISGMSLIPQATPTKMGLKESLTSISRYDEGTSGVRLAIWDNSLSIINDHPLFGVGLAGWYVHYPLYNRAAQADPIFSTKEQPAFMHNDPLQLIAETSVVGLVLYAALFILVLWRSMKAFYSSKESAVRLRIIFGITAIIAFTVNSLFTFPIRMAIPSFFLMVILGLLVSLDVQTIKETKHSVFPIKNYAINSLTALFALFSILVIVFNFSMILADYYYLRSSFFNRVKNWRIARVEAQKAADFIPWRHKIWFELGKATDHLGLDDEAAEAYKNALSIHPNHMNSLLNLGHVYLKKGDFEKASYVTQKALIIKPDFDKALFNMGLMNDRKGQAKEAISYYQRCVRANPRYAEAHYRLGVIYLNENRVAESRKHLERCAELKGEMPGIHFNLGIVYERLRMPEKAVSEYQKELEINPESAESYNNLGLISAREKKWEEAVPLYKQAIETDPDLGAAHINIAVAYYMLGDYNSSWKHSRIGERLGLPQAKVLIKRLKEVSNYVKGGRP